MTGTLKDVAYEFVLRNVEDGTHTAGMCPSEVALAKELGTSRGLVRKAITRLASEGVIEQLICSGSVVGCWDLTPSHPSLRVTLEDEGVYDWY